MTQTISDRVNLHFKQEFLDGILLVKGFVYDKLVGQYEINMKDPERVKGKIRTFERGKGYARPLIERVIEILREKKVAHYVHISNPEAEKRLTRIFKDKGYIETEQGFLVFNYG